MPGYYLGLLSYFLFVALHMLSLTAVSRIRVGATRLAEEHGF